ncbi:DUF7139 domain-containing protein [Halobacterium zhouii]|uniref:DUF7139 domain-containing protein n=1 Tax=Halobacterium zhouii TaxID=2902624 RepID=UPI001E4EEA76|nr:hypothetical protein [Halobacterium zhouii]
MTSLGETYDRRAGEASQRRVYLGTGLFAAGALLVVGGILAGATGLLITNGFGPYESREIAGILAGLGIPAVFVGIFSVLPANQLQRAAAAVGSGLAVLGVMLFRAAYPENWYAGATSVPSTETLAFVVVYFAGIITTFWCLFTAVATFKTRNDPGGTVTLTVTKDGETHTVEVPAGNVESAREALTSGSFGGVGVFGGVEDPEQQTRANTAQPDPSPGPASASVSDGGATSQDITSPLDEEMVDDDAAVGPDEYCGNCTHFDYAETGDGMQPYCGLYDEDMDDMEACEWWEPNN